MYLECKRANCSWQYDFVRNMVCVSLTNDGWMMDDLRFYLLFNSILVITGGRVVDNESVCNGIPCTVKKISPSAGLKPGTARSAGERLTP